NTDITSTIITNTDISTTLVLFLADITNSICYFWYDYSPHSPLSPALTSPSALLKCWMCCLGTVVPCCGLQRLARHTHTHTHTHRHTHTHTHTQGSVPIAGALRHSSRANTRKVTHTHTHTHTGFSTYSTSIDAQLPNQHQEDHTHTHTHTTLQHTQ